MLYPERNTDDPDDLEEYLDRHVRDPDWRNDKDDYDYEEPCEKSDGDSDYERELAKRRYGKGTAPKGVPPPAGSDQERKEMTRDREVWKSNEQDRRPLEAQLNQLLRDLRL